MSNLVETLVERILRPIASRRLSVDIEAAARMTSLSTRTIHRLVADGTLPSAKIGSRRVIALAELENLVR